MTIAGKVADKIVNSHHMVIENRLCSRFRTPKSDCSLCADICPVNAVSVSEKCAEIQGGCTDCGVCISVCPNGAFSVNGRDDKRIAEEIGSRVKGQGIKKFRISCEYGDETSDLILPCLSRLTEALLLEPIKAGASDVEILRPLCEGCSNKKAAPQLERVVMQIRNLSGLLGIKEDCISVSSVEFRENKNSELRTPNSELQQISRREFFGSFRNKAIEVALAAIPENGDRDNGRHEIFRDVIQNKTENYKRSMLLASIKDIRSRVNSALRAPHSALDINKHEVPSADCIVAELEVNSGCTACGVCATLCPAGAITGQWTDGHYRLSYKPALCTNCKVCVEVCMPKAIKIKDRVSPGLLFGMEEAILFKAEKKNCVVCGNNFVRGESEICPLCEHIHKKQMAAVKNLFKKEV